MNTGVSSPRLSRFAVACLLATAVAACGGAASTPTSEVPKTFGPSPEQIDGKRWLADTARIAERAGAGKLQLLAVGAGTPGDHIPGLVNVPRDRCALVYARGSDSVDDLDLFVYGDDGAQFGSDEAPDDLPTLLVCPDEPRRLYVTARVAEGNGIVAVGVQEVSRQSADAVARAVGARNYGPASHSKAEMWPGLAESIAAHRERIGGTWHDIRRVALPVDSRVATRITARAAAGACLDALVLPSEEVSHVSLQALDENGRIFAHSQTMGLERALVICSGADTDVTFEVRPHAGRGTVVLVLSTTSPGGAADLEPEAPRTDLIPLETGGSTRDRTNRALQARGVPAPRSVAKGQSRVGARTSIDLPLGGGCHRIDVWGTGDLLGLETHAWTNGGELLARGTGLSSATSFLCSKEETSRMDVEATRRGGEFLVDVRSERDVPEALVRHPLAAARLLTRMHEHGMISTVAEAGEVRALTLVPHYLQRLQMEVPAERCLDVHLGVGAEARGAEVRLVDAESGLELGFSRGAYAAGTQVCALETDKPLDVTLEVRVASGRSTGLVATKIHSLRPGATGNAP